MLSLFTRFTRYQQNLCNYFDQMLPGDYRIDGNRDFVDNWIAPYLKKGALLYDVGGGKNPIINVELKQRLELRVLGLDIDADELAAAPAEAYDETICHDITHYRGRGDADLVICQALLEHVKDTQAAIEAIASILQPGGIALIFLPCRNAVFARLNLLLPQSLKRKLLHTVFPFTARDQGFPAYYDRCTPRDFRRFAATTGLTVQACQTYFRSMYFSFFFPLHVLWRMWQLTFRSFVKDQAAETFSLALRKNQTCGADDNNAIPNSALQRNGYGRIDRAAQAT